MGNDNVVGLLGGILGCLQIIAKNTTQTNGKAESGREVVSRMNRGSLDVSNVAPADGGDKMSDVKSSKVANVVSIVTALKDISPIIKQLAGLSGRTLKKFDKTVMSVIDTINKIEKHSLVKENTAKSTKAMVETLTILTGTVKQLALVAPLAPIAFASIVLISPTLLLLAGLMTLIGGFKNIESGTKAIKNMQGFAKETLLFVAAGILMILASVGLGLLIKKNKSILDSALLGFVAISVAMIALAGLTWAASKIMKDVKVPENMFYMMGMILLSAGFVLLCSFLGDFVKERVVDILIGFGSVSAIVLATAGLAWLVAKMTQNPSTKAGIASIAIMMGVLTGAMGIIFLSLKLSEKAKGKWGDIGISLAACLGIITAIGALAALAGMVGPQILIGSIALGSVLLVMFGAIKLVHSVIDLIDVKKKAGTGWPEIAKNVAGVGLILGEITVLGTVIGLAAAAAILAIPGLMRIRKMSELMFSVVYKLIDLSDALKKSGGVKDIQDLLNNDIQQIMSALSLQNLDVPMTPKEIRELKRKYRAMSNLVSEFGETLRFLSMLAEFGQMVNSSGDVAPIMSKDKATGKLTLGEYVNIGHVAEVISTSINSFVDNLSIGVAKANKIIEANAVVVRLGYIVDPISKFVNMLMSFKCDGNSIAPITIDKDGKYKVGEPVDVVAVSTLIVKSITAFTDEMYSDANIKKWTEKVYGSGGRKATKGIERALGVLSDTVGPISSFVDLMTKYKTDGVTISTISYDDKGKLKLGEAVNISDTATALASVVTTFATAMYGADNIKKWADLSASGNYAINDLYSPLTTMIEVISKYTELDGAKIDSNAASIKSFYDTTLGAGLVKYATFATTLKISVDKLSEGLKKFIEVLSDRSGERKTAMENFGKEIDELANKFDKVSNSINGLSNLISTLEHMDTEKINTNVGALNVGAINDIHTGTGGTSSRSVSKLTVDDITAAVRSALNGLKLSSSNTGTNPTGGSDESIIAVNALNIRLGEILKEYNISC